MKNKRMLGNLLLLLTAFIWGTAFVFQRLGNEKIEPITFNAARMALAAAAVGLTAALLRRRERRSGAADAQDRRRRDRYTLWGGVCCGVCLTTASILQQMGLVYTTAGKAGFITAMYMLLVPIIRFVFFRKKNTWLVWGAVALGVAGMYLLCVTEQFRLTRGDTLVCLCAVFFSGHILCCDFFVRRGDGVGISAIQFAVAAVLSAVVARFTESTSPAGLLGAAVPILYCGLISGGVGYTLQIIAQKFTDPTVASLLMSMESVFAVLAGAALLGERMSLRELLGCVVMFIAIVIVQLPAPENSASRRPGTPS